MIRVVPLFSTQHLKETYWIIVKN